LAIRTKRQSQNPIWRGRVNILMDRNTRPAVIISIGPSHGIDRAGRVSALNQPFGDQSAIGQFRRAIRWPEFGDGLIVALVSYPSVPIDFRPCRTASKNPDQKKPEDESVPRPDQPLECIHDRTLPTRQPNAT